MNLSRRTVLRGAGVALGLPWLEATAQTPKPPVRMAVLYMPNGVNTALWTPEGAGRAFQFSPTLAPLASFRDDVIVVSIAEVEAAIRALAADHHVIAEGAGAAALAASAKIPPGRNVAIVSGGNLDWSEFTRILGERPT